MKAFFVPIWRENPRLGGITSTWTLLSVQWLGVDPTPQASGPLRLIDASNVVRDGNST